LRGISFIGYEKEFRGAIDSEDLNNDFKAIYNDLAESYRRLQYINGKLTEYASDVSYQNQQLDNRLNELEDALIAASGHYATAGGNLMYWSAYSDSELASNTSRHNMTTGDITLPWTRSWTKIPLISNAYGDYEPSTAVSIAYDDGVEVYKNKPDDMYDMVDNNPETNWVHTYDTTGAPASVTVRIELPSSTNPAIDSVYAAPFPEGGPTITNIRYLTSAGSWTQISNFSSTDRRRRWHFSPVDYNNQVDITITPADLLDSAGNSVKVFGLQDVDVSLIEYVSSSDFIIKLSAAPGDTISAITYVYLEYTISPSIREANIDDTDRPVILRIYEDAALTTRVYSNLIYAHPYTGSISLGTPSNSIWAKVNLQSINSTTPVVRSITVRYE